jgi:hypothetical protein
MELPVFNEPKVKLIWQLFKICCKRIEAFIDKNAVHTGFKTYLIGGTSMGG